MQIFINWVEGTYKKTSSIGNNGEGSTVCPGEPSHGSAWGYELIDLDFFSIF